MTIEEYLHSLISLIEELARLAVNSVTLGDYHRPLEISRFVKDLHAAFQLLNLKNDTLRKRSDSIKYNVSKSLKWKHHILRTFKGEEDRRRCLRSLVTESRASTNNENLKLLQKSLAFICSHMHHPQQINLSDKRKDSVLTVLSDCALTLTPRGVHRTPRTPLVSQRKCLADCRAYVLRNDNGVHLLRM